MGLQCAELMPQEAALPDRRSIRIKSFDYAQAGTYFITICSHGKRCIFGNIVEEKFIPNALGKIVDHCWRAIPEHFPGTELEIHVVMPNHFHGLISLPKLAPKERAQHAAPLRERSGAVEATRAIAPRSLGTIVRSFKAAVTSNAREKLRRPTRVWQRSYYEHVIRNKRDFHNAWEYIRWNPQRWSRDSENPSRLPSS